MSFIWPGLLFGLILVPLLLALYIWMLRRRRRYAVRFSSLSLVRQALPKQSRWRRHVPFALFLLALTSLLVAMARPVQIITVPANQATIILSIDVSFSMRQNDIQPSRLEAAQAAAVRFIQRQKAGTQIGIVAFSGFAEEIQPPTSDQEESQAAVESLTLGRRTAIGAGILKALDAIHEADPNVAASTNPDDPTSAPTPVPKGAYAPDIIVLLTDGVSNTGPLPLDAAQQAADRGVRVYTIGYGTAMGGDFPFDRRGGGGGNGNPFGGGNGFGGGSNNQQPQFGGFRRGIDEQTLKQIADSTGGQYYAASSADELQKIFDKLPTYLITRHETSEISFIFAAVGALLAGAAIVLSLLWHPLS